MRVSGSSEIMVLSFWSILPLIIFWYIFRGRRWSLLWVPVIVIFGWIGFLIAFLAERQRDVNTSAR